MEYHLMPMTNSTYHPTLIKDCEDEYSLIKFIKMILKCYEPECWMKVTRKDGRSANIGRKHKSDIEWL